MNQTLVKVMQTVTSTALMLTLITACGQGAQTTAVGKSSPNTSQATPDTGSTPTPAAPTWTSVSAEVNSSVSGGAYNQYPLIQINSAAQTLVLRLPFPPLTIGSITPIVSVNVPNFPGVTVGPASLPDGTTGWAVSIPLKYLLQKNGAGLQPLATLPNGSPLPYFPSAQVNGIAITLPQMPKYQLTVYVALKAVAVFISIPELKIPLGFSYQVVNSAKTRNIGYFALIPTAGAFPAGIYLAAQIPTDVSSALNSLVSF